jgi:hypothetical protein
MSEAWAAIIVTSIPVLGGGIGWLIKNLLDFREENRKDHGIVLEAINEIKNSVDEVKDDLHGHIEWHLVKKD